MSRFSITCCICTRSASAVGNSGSSCTRGDDIARDEFTVHQVEGFAHQVVEIDGCVLRVALAQQRPQPLNDLRGAFIVLDDVLEDFDELGRARGSFLQHAQRRLGVAEDRRERLFELMRKRARQLAENRGARQVRELLTLIARVRLGAFARGDIGTCDHGATFGTAQTFERHFEPAGLAVAGAAAVDQAVVIGAIENRTQRGQVIGGGAVALFSRARTTLQVVFSGEHAVETGCRRRIHRVAPRIVDLDDRAAAVELPRPGRAAKRARPRADSRPAAGATRRGGRRTDRARRSRRLRWRGTGNGRGSPGTRRPSRSSSSSSVLSKRSSRSPESGSKRTGLAIPRGHVVETQLAVLDVGAADSGEAQERLVRLADAQVVAPDRGRE